MTDPVPLIERLLAMYSHRGDGIPTQYVNPDGPEAAARIATLERQVEGLREALEAILKVRVNGWDNIWAGANRCQAIARQALADTAPQSESAS